MRIDQLRVGQDLSGQDLEAFGIVFQWYFKNNVFLYELVLKNKKILFLKASVILGFYTW
jgi:hypothetical protein